MKKRFSIITLVFLMIASVYSHGAGNTIEEGLVRRIPAGIGVFYHEQGRLPTTWKEIQQYYPFQSENEALARVHGYRLEDRYKFVTKPYPIFEFLHGNGYDIDEGSRVLIVRLIPYKDRESGKLMRDFIYMTSSGVFGDAHIYEKEQAQKLFKMYGVAPQVPPGLPEFDIIGGRPGLSSPGKIPDPDDARRVWPPGPRRAQDGTSAKADGAGALATVGGDSGTSGVRLYVLLCIAATALFSGAWLLLRLRKKGGKHGQ